jgi:hypothetical protein
MNQLTYNVGLLVGTASLSCGAGLQWGVGFGLMAFGGLVIVLTMAGAWISARAA